MESHKMIVLHYLGDFVSFCALEKSESIVNLMGEKCSYEYHLATYVVHTHAHAHTQTRTNLYNSLNIIGPIQFMTIDESCVILLIKIKTRVKYE